MLRLRRDDMPYRPCVGVMLLNRAGEVFVGRRIDRMAEAWQMPQGGIDPGEDPQAAAFRELMEETGVTAASLLAEHPDWVTYDLPDALLGRVLHGKYRGQRQKWFAMRFEGTDADVRIETAEPEFDAWRWVPMEAVVELVVPFKRETYTQVVAAFRHLAAPA